MICVRHRDASGTLDSLWEYDEARHVVVLAHLGEWQDIPVASLHAPRHGSYFISRKGEDSWQIAPAYFEKQHGSWQTIAMPFPDGKLVEFIMLTSAPERTRVELERL